jgi:DNA-binding NarL/FixJ family response regulator
VRDQYNLRADQLHGRGLAREDHSGLGETSGGGVVVNRRTAQQIGRGQAVTDRPIRVLVATLPALWSEVLGRLLERERDLHVVGRAHSEDQLREAVATHNPHVILFDYEALGPNSEGIIARLRRAAPSARTLVFATGGGDETTIAVLRAGAMGLVGKQLGYPALLAALRAVAAGELWAHRRVTAQAIDQLVSPVLQKQEVPSQLTKREWEVVEGVGKGLRNREIADALGINERTVKSHLNNIFSKTRVSSRFALSLWSRGEVKRKRQP